MEIESKTHLVIISVPFYRIARVSLSPVVLGILRERSDVVIVAPFAEAAGFKEGFGASGTVFLQWQLNPMSRYQFLLLAISEIVRRNGYWKRFRKRGLSYYFKNQFRVFGDSGRDTQLGPVRRLAYWVLATVGQWRKAWVLVDRLLGKRWCRFPPLVALSKQYDRVTLIQSANWGLQDRALASLSREHRWRAVLLPYTSDQLDTNGYLFNRFDAVCVQGTYESKRAIEIHAVPESRIERLGSAWFRHLEHLKAAIDGERGDSSAEPGFILYAGVSSTYFPRDSEIEAVDAIAEYLSRSRTGLRLVYRPVEFDESRKERLQRRYEGSPLVQLQWPSISLLGLEQYSDVKQDMALREYVRSLTGCKLLVMSYLTSLAMDAAFLQKCGVISNMSDAAGVLRKRYTHLLNTEGNPGIRFVASIPELLETMESLLNNPERAAQESAQIIAQWDYRDVNFRESLIQAVYGKPMEPGPAL